jgi:hypothetical protein
MTESCPTCGRRTNQNGLSSQECNDQWHISKPANTQVAPEPPDARAHIRFLGNSLCRCACNPMCDCDCHKLTNGPVAPEPPQTAKWMIEAAEEIRHLCIQQAGYLNAALTAEIIAKHAAEVARASWEQGRDAAAKVAEDALIPEAFKKTGIYTDFEAGGDDCLKSIAAAIRALTPPGVEPTKRIDTEHCDMCQEPVKGSVHYELVSGRHRCLKCMKALDAPQDLSGSNQGQSQAGAEPTKEAEK